MLLPAPPLPDWLARMLPRVERSLVEIGGVRLHVMEAGPADGIPVVMLHGNPTWGFLWRKVVARLEGARVILPDLLGLGLSDHPRDPAVHTLERHARLVGGLVDALAPGKLVFVGHDWGGPIGLRALADRPDRLARAASTACRSVSGVIGLRTKSVAPSFIASTASSIVA